MNDKEENDQKQEDIIDDIEFEIEDHVVEESGLDAKNKKLRSDLKLAKDQIQEYLVGWQKERASFANYKTEEEKKRKERLDMMKVHLVSDFFPVLDSFDMAFGNQEAWEKVDPAWRSGIEYIYTQFINVLDTYNLSMIDKVGIYFDPKMHEPIEHLIVNNENQDSKIIKVVQKGYLSGDMVLRAAKVIVGKYEDAGN
jgi:molecular chaperone GrpE